MLLARSLLAGSVLARSVLARLPVPRTGLPALSALRATPGTRMAVAVMAAMQTPDLDQDRLGRSRVRRCVLDGGPSSRSLLGRQFDSVPLGRRVGRRGLGSN